jgi:gluconokinase
MASGTGLLEIRSGRWHESLADDLGVRPGMLPPIGDEAMRLDPKRRADYPELADSAWFPALGDGAASNLGSAATMPDLAAINVGTSAAVRIVSASPKASFGLFSYRIDAKRFLIGGAVSNAGILRQWCLENCPPLGGNEAAIESALAKRTGPVPGLTVLPFWMTERAPTWPEDVPAAVVGMTLATTSLDLLQALGDAAFLRLAEIANRLPRLAEKSLRFSVSGGVQHSPAALQRLADCLGSPVLKCQEPEASLRGAAVFALENLGVNPQPLAQGRLVRPRPEAAAAYAIARRRQNALEKTLAGQIVRHR